MKHSPHLLVVEDDASIRDLLDSELSEYMRSFAKCQKEAYEWLERQKFDLVLLDLRLPREVGDMIAEEVVGRDVLRTIRERGLRRRDSEMCLPVIVMTAHGNELLTSELIVDDDADFYVPKPFEGDILQRRIEDALAGPGNYTRRLAASRSTEPVHISFDPQDSRSAWVEGYVHSRATRDLLWALHARFLEDQRNGRPSDNFQRVPGDALADELGITLESLRARVKAFRDRVRADFLQRLGRTVSDDDIVQSGRGVHGYRLNPRVVRIIAWHEISD